MSAALQVYYTAFDAVFFKLPAALRARIEAKVDEVGSRLASFPHERLEDSDVIDPHFASQSAGAFVFVVAGIDDPGFSWMRFPPASPMPATGRHVACAELWRGKHGLTRVVWLNVRKRSGFFGCFEVGFLMLLLACLGRSGSS